MEPKIPTKERLAQALEALNDPWLASLIARAKEGFYDDFESQLVAPTMVLVSELKMLGHEAFAQRVINGEFDGTKEEAEAWFEKEDQHYISQITSLLGFKVSKKSKPKGFG